jgi:hypothetical protein
MHSLRANVLFQTSKGKFGMPQTLQRPRAVNAFHFRPGGSSTALTSSAARAGPNHVAQPDPQRRAVLARPVAHGASSQPGPSHPTAAARLAPTLGSTVLAMPRPRKISCMRWSSVRLNDQNFFTADHSHAQIASISHQSQPVIAYDSALNGKSRIASL